MISIRLRCLYRRLSYFTAFLRDFRPGMQTFIPLSFNACRRQSASYPRSPKSQSAFGRLLSSAAAPVSSLTCPADMKTWIGRPFASVTACNFVFMPPFVRPIWQARPPFFTRRLEAVRCAFKQVASIMMGL